jgi:hypothetical protein
MVNFWLHAFHFPIQFCFWIGRVLFLLGFQPFFIYSIFTFIFIHSIENLIWNCMSSSSSWSSWCRKITLIRIIRANDLVIMYFSWFYFILKISYIFCIIFLTLNLFNQNPLFLNLYNYLSYIFFYYLVLIFVVFLYKYWYSYLNSYIIDLFL